MEKAATMPRVVCAVSSIKDRSMKYGDVDFEENRRAFIESMGADSALACIVRLAYEGEDYRRYHTIDKARAGEGAVTESKFVADALLTREKGMTLFLPLGDCVGAVIWDKNHTTLMVSHLGRHNLEQEGGRHSIEYFTKQTGVPSKDIKVYLTPAAGKDNYPIHSLDGKGLHEAAIEQLVSAGIDRANIEVDVRDTTKDEQLFSHSEFLKGNQQTNGRHAVFAVLV